jgi:hypothetical protein
MNFYAFPKFTQKSAKTKEKEKHFCLGNPEFSTNQAAVQTHYSYDESVVRIWNPVLFHILT